jgi:predicted DNA-binding protein
MRSNPKRAYSTRLPLEQADQLDVAIEETDLNRSEFLRCVVEFYLEKNPDQLEALSPDELTERMIADLES